MRLAVFGASGKVGSLIVYQALEKGHEVTAFLRTSSKLQEAGIPATHERLKIVQGDVHNAKQVSAAVEGQEAVLSAVGRTRTSGKDVLAAAARNLLSAMEQHDVRRLVSLLGAGVPDSRDSASFGRSLMRGVMKLTVRDMLEDADSHADQVRASSLDWTIVRPPRLIDGPRTGSYRTGYLNLGPMETISRADLADFMLRLAVEGGYEREAPMISY